MQVIVQSGHKGPNHLDERVEAFLTQYRQTELAAYSAADPDSSRKLEGFRAAVCEKLTEKPKNIDQVGPCTVAVCCCGLICLAVAGSG